MTFDEWWETLCRKTPELRNGDNKMIITVRSFKKIFQRAFKAGSVTEEAMKKAAADFKGVERPFDPLGAFKDIFCGL